MTVDEMRKLYGIGLKADGKRKRGHAESDIQQACVRWFRWEYPRYLCFAVPNGGSRNAVEGANMKKEGVLAGVSDLIVIADHKVLFVEMKTRKGRQQDTQKEFQHRVEVLGFRYVVCRSLDDFINAVRAWLGRTSV